MPKRQDDQKNTDLQQLNTAIERQVRRALGEPADLHSVQVRRLWANHYRVNVFTGPDTVSTRIANSFFLVIDTDGNVVQSVPEIARVY